jgi:hypothetical protein
MSVMHKRYPTTVTNGNYKKEKEDVEHITGTEKNRNDFLLGIKFILQSYKVQTTDLWFAPYRYSPRTNPDWDIIHRGIMGTIDDGINRLVRSSKVSHKVAKEITLRVQVNIFNYYFTAWKTRCLQLMFHRIE